VDRTTAIVIARAWVFRDGHEAIWRSQHQDLFPSLVDALVASFPDPDAWTILHDTTRPEVAVLAGSVVHCCGVKGTGFGSYTTDITGDHTVVNFVEGKEPDETPRWQIAFGGGGDVELPLQGRTAVERRRDEAFARAVARAVRAQAE
jgi:hypothetical protein